MGSPNNQFKRSKSYILTSCLVAVSFAIINCQKAPNRTGVKPNVANPAPNTKTELDPKDQCEASIKNSVETMRLAYKDKETDVRHVSSAGKSDSDKQALKEKRSKFLDECMTVVPTLEKIKEKSCFLDKSSKAVKGSAEYDKNVITLPEMKQSCDKAKKLFCEDGGTHSYGGNCAAATPDRPAATGTAAEKERKEKQSRATEYLKTILVLASDEVKDLSKENKESNFKKYLTGGEIKSDKALETANSSSRPIVCSLSGVEIDKTVSKSVIMKFTDDYKAVAKSEDALAGFKGDAMTVTLGRENDNSEKGMYDGSASNPILLTLTCLNVKATAIDIGALKQALGITKTGGKHIKEIDAADLEKLRNANKAQHDKEKADQVAAAARAEEARRLAQGGGGAPQAVPVAPAVALTEVEKKALIKAVTDARMALGEQKTKSDGLKVKVTNATTEINTAKAAIVAKKVEGEEFTTLAKKLIEAAKLVISTEAKLTEVNKGTDTAAKTAAKTANDNAKLALANLENSTTTKDKVKTAGSVKDFVALYVKFLDAVANQAALATESTAEEVKVKELEAKVAAAIKTALDRKVTETELAETK